jgi:dipeptidyl aminopeptidase/acylaminoacyl peptidase
VPERRVAVSPQFSPDGRTLAFLSPDSAGVMQVWLLPMTGDDPAAARQLTSHSTDVAHFIWRPDGGGIAFAASDPKPKRDGAARFVTAFSVGDQDIFALETPRPRHIWLTEVGTARERRLTSGAWTVELPLAFNPASGMSWSPDGRTIAFPRMVSTESGKSDSVYINLLDVATGSIRPLTSARRFEHGPLFSPDGRSIAYSYPRGGSSGEFWGGETWLAPASGGPGRSLTRGLDRMAFGPRWMPDGKSLLVAGDDGVGVAAWIQSIDGPAKRLSLGDLVLTGSFGFDITVATHAPVIAFTASTPNRPSELYVMDSLTARPRRITNFNAWATDLAWGKMERATWKSDRFDVDGVVGYPPDFSPSRKYPLVLMIHGGPAMGAHPAFSSTAQLLAAEGWIVFQPNYRGSDNLGAAFLDAGRTDFGPGPGRDVMTGLAMLRQRSYVDRSRTAVTGWSWGGFMTAWLIGNYPNEWKAAVAGAPVTKLEDEYNLSDGNITLIHFIGGSPYTGDRIRAYRAQSPITYASRVKTPTLIMGMTQDPVVPTTEPLAFFHALRDNGVETQFVAFPGRGHFPPDPVNAREVLRVWVDWVKRHFDASSQQ